MKNIAMKWTTTKETESNTTSETFKRRSDLSIYCEAGRKSGRAFFDIVKDLKTEQIVKEVDFYVELTDKKAKVYEEKHIELQKAKDNLQGFINKREMFQEKLNSQQLNETDEILYADFIVTLSNRMAVTKQEIADLAAELPALKKAVEEQYAKVAEVLYPSDTQALMEMEFARRKSSLSRVLDSKQLFEQAADNFLDKVISIIEQGGAYCRTANHKVYRYGTYYQGALSIDAAKGGYMKFSIDINTGIIGFFDDNNEPIGKGTDLRDIKWLSDDYGNEVIFQMFNELVQVETLMIRRNFKFKGKHKMQRVILDELATGTV